MSEELLVFIFVAGQSFMCSLGVGDLEVKVSILQKILKVFLVHQPIVVKDVFGTESKLWIRLKHVVD